MQFPEAGMAGGAYFDTKLLIPEYFACKSLFLKDFEGSVAATP
jgi:hypothetical protein